MECCGKIVTTPFCPLCGKKQKEGPLWQLLDHVRTQIHFKEVKARAAEERGTGGDSEGRLLKTVRENIQKWKYWEKALCEVLERQEKSSIENHQ